MANEFQYDVFLNHNTKDKARVRRLAEPLRVAGLLVWFDEWVINPGDDIYLAIKRGLEAACVHAFPAVDSQRRRMQCLSPVALGSDCLGLTRRAKPTTDGPEVF